MNTDSAAYLSAMASQHPSEQTNEEMATVLDTIIKSFTSLQKDIQDIVKEAKEIKVLFTSVQSQTLIAKDVLDGVIDVDVKDNQGGTEAKENQDSIACAQGKYSSSDKFPSNMEDQDQKIHKVSEGITEETTAEAVLHSEAANTTDKKENTTDKQNDLSYWGFIFSYINVRNSWSWLLSTTKDAEEKYKENHGHPESSVSGKTHQIQDISGQDKEKTDDQNVIELSKESLSEKLGMFKTAFESCLKQLQSHKVHLEETFKAFKKENKYLMEHVQTLTKLSKPDPSDVMKTKTKGESKSSRSDYLWSLRKRYKVVSQLYCQYSSDLITSVMEGLPAMLTTQMNTHGIKLKMQICKSVQDIKTDVPLILICLQSSRLGTDVSNAIKGIKTGPNVAVLILHHADSHALPTQSSRKILTAPEYKKINTMVDMGFLSEKGIYDCAMNTKALNDLTSFLKQ